jgi:predicted Abi (CAAX) family protease
MLRPAQIVTAIPVQQEVEDAATGRCRTETIAYQVGLAAWFLVGLCRCAGLVTIRDLVPWRIVEIPPNAIVQITHPMEMPASTTTPWRMWLEPREES